MTDPGAESMAGSGSGRLPVPYSERKLPGPILARQSDETSLRALICRIGHQMHSGGYIAAAAGTISARLDATHLLITPHGLAKGFLQPDQLLLLDLDGNGQATDANRELDPPGDLPLHLQCYQQRPDAWGVILAQPPTAIALTIAGVSMRTCVVPEAVITLGVIPTTSAFLPSSPEAREAIRALIPAHDALLIAYHGSLTVGADVWQAYLKLELLEYTAQVLHKAAQLGPISPLPPDKVASLLETRRRLGYWRPGDEERFCEMCGVC
jgi:L-fuculose-phosphate aldolase